MSIPFLNVPLPLFKQYKNYQKFSEKNNLNDNERKLKTQMDVMRKKIENFSSANREIIEKYSQKKDYNFTAFEFFDSKFRDLFLYLENLQICPEHDLEILKHDFSRAIYFLFYYDNNYTEKNDDIINIIKDICQKIQDLFNKIEADTKFNHDLVKEILSAFHEFLDDPALLNAPIALLIKISSFEDPQYKLSITELLKSYKYVCDQLLKFSPQDFFYQSLQNMKDPMSDQEVENLSNLTVKLGTFVREFFTQLSKESSNSILTFKKDKEKKQKLLNIKKLVIKFICEFSMKDKVNEINVTLKQLEADPTTPKAVIEMMERKLFFYQKIHSIQFFYNCILLPKTNFLIGASKLLSACCFKKSDSFLTRLEKCSQAKSQSASVTPKPIPAKTSEPEKSIEELMKFIDGDTEKTIKGKNSTQKKKKTLDSRKNQKTENKQRAKSTPVRYETKQVFCNLKNISDLLPANENYFSALSNLENSNESLRKVSLLLKQLSNQPSTNGSQPYFQQASMYLEDVMTAYPPMMDDSQSHSVRLLYIMAFLQGIYFCCESLFQGEMVKRTNASVNIGNGHNLNELYHSSGLEMEKNNLFSDFFLMNYWVVYPFERHSASKSLGVPIMLDKVKKIYKGNISENAQIKSMVKNFEELLPRLEQCILLFPSVREIKETTPEIDCSLRLTFKTSFPTEKFTTIRDKCEILKSKLPRICNHKLSQVICYLKLIEGACKELNKKELSSAQLSLLVRQLVFWKNALIGSFLQILFSFKKGYHTKSHDLIELQKIICIESGEQLASNIKDRSFLEEMKPAHNFSRYPYTTDINEAGKPLHSVISRIEQLRNKVGIGLEEFSETDMKKLKQITDQTLAFVEKIFSELNAYVILQGQTS